MIRTYFRCPLEQRALRNLNGVEQGEPARIEPRRRYPLINAVQILDRLPMDEFCHTFAVKSVKEKNEK